MEPALPGEAPAVRARGGGRHTGDPSPERIPAILEAVQNAGATDAALERARELVEEGLAALKVLPETPHREALERLAHHLVDRIA